MSSPVYVRRIPLESEHDNQKWLVLEGFIEHRPELNKRVTINTAALADGSVTLEGIKAKLIADVQEYETRMAAVQQALASELVK